MLIPPKYFLTPKISKLLSSIEASREVIDSINIPPEVELNIRRQSTLKSSLFSARIEGNPLTLEELTRNPSRDQKRTEVYNILKALNWIRARGARDLTKTSILELHKIVMQTLVDKQDLGTFRQEVSAIYNRLGIAIYLPPPPRQVSKLVARMLQFANSDKQEFVPLRACLTHYIFEKIHPFLDGNGRVGRIVLQAVLEKGGYGMKGLVPFEEYLDRERSVYYRVLENSDRDVTDYLEFMLKAISRLAEDAKKQVLGKTEGKVEDTLLPRRLEILNIIRDKKLVNFDIIRRRFLKVNERTLRYDIKKLVDMGLVSKRGTTRGVYYESVQKDLEV